MCKSSIFAVLKRWISHTEFKMKELCRKTLLRQRSEHTGKIGKLRFLQVTFPTFRCRWFIIYAHQTCHIWHKYCLRKITLLHLHTYQLTKIVTVSRLKCMTISNVTASSFLNEENYFFSLEFFICVRIGRDYNCGSVKSFNATSSRIPARAAWN